MDCVLETVVFSHAPVPFRRGDIPPAICAPIILDAKSSFFGRRVSPTRFHLKSFLRQNDEFHSALFTPCFRAVVLPNRVRAFHELPALYLMQFNRAVHTLHEKVGPIAALVSRFSDVIDHEHRLV